MKQNSYKQLSKQIKLAISAPKYDITDFWSVCPISPSEVCSESRQRLIVSARHVAATWMVLSGDNAQRAAALIERDHATVLHSMKRVMEALEHPRQHPEIMEIINMTKDMAKRSLSNVGDVEVASALHLELAFRRMRPWEYDSSQFYCQQMVIAERMGEPGKRCEKQCGGCK